MRGRTKGNGPRAVAAATEAKVVRYPQGTTPDSASELGMAIRRPDPHDFPLGVVWECEHRGELARFSVTEMQGSRFADLRRYYRRAGHWLPTRKGCTIPLSGLHGFCEGLGRYLAANEPDESQDAA